MIGKSDFDLFGTAQIETRIGSQLKVFTSYVNPRVIMGAATGW